MITRPNAEEMGTLLSLDRQRFSSSLTLLKISELDPSQPLPTHRVMQLGLIDWMDRLGLLDPLTRVATVNAFESAIEFLAQRYDNLEIENDKRLRRPAAGFTLLDNCVATMQSPYNVNGYYVVTDGEWTMSLPHMTLTAVTCDLSVLMLQTLDKMKKTFKTAG